jgi:hypothetical protein
VIVYTILNNQIMAFRLRSQPPIKQTKKKPKPVTIESKVNSYLGDPKGRAEEMSDMNPNNDYVDNVRHAFAGRYTQEAISKKMGGGIIGNIGGLIGANAMGIGHELSNITKDTRSIGTVVRESAEDAFNNAVGSVIGASPFGTKKQKDKTIYKLSVGNLLPDGYVSDAKKKKPDDDLYFREKGRKLTREY